MMTRMQRPPVAPASRADDPEARPAARWDGRRVLFEVQHEMQPVPCAVLPVVLREMALGPCFKAKDILRCFVAARGRIEAAALGKLGRRAPPYPMPLAVWSSDLEDQAAASRPGGPARLATRPAGDGGSP